MGKSRQYFFWKDCDTLSLSEADRLLKNLHVRRMQDQIQDTLLLLSHFPCLALGARKLNPDDLLKPLEWFSEQGIQLIKTVRGGGLTYHWPGQVVCYPVLKLLPHERNLNSYMFRLEEVALRTLHDLGVEAYRRRDSAAQIGLWWNDRKVASMGVHVARWVTSYGFALNISGDASPSRFIRPCGLDGARLITVSEITRSEAARSTVISSIIRHFSDVFNRQMTSGSFTMLENPNLKQSTCEESL